MSLQRKMLQKSHTKGTETNDLKDDDVRNFIEAVKPSSFSLTMFKLFSLILCEKKISRNLPNNIENIYSYFTVARELRKI